MAPVFSPHRGRLSGCGESPPGPVLLYPRDALDAARRISSEHSRHPETGEEMAWVVGGGVGRETPGRVTPAASVRHPRAILKEIWANRVVKPMETRAGC